MLLRFIFLPYCIQENTMNVTASFCILDQKVLSASCRLTRTSISMRGKTMFADGVGDTMGRRTQVPQSIASCPPKAELPGLHVGHLPEWTPLCPDCWPAQTWTGKLWSDLFCSHSYLTHGPSADGRPRFNMVSRSYLVNNRKPKGTDFIFPCLRMHVLLEGVES